VESVSNAGNASRTVSRAGGRRRGQVAIGVLVVVGLAVGYAYAVPPAAGVPVTAAAATSTQVSAATVVCPIVTGAGLAGMAAFGPVVPGAPSGSAQVSQIGTRTPLATIKTAGGYASAPNLSGAVTNLADDSLPLVGQAMGGLAPGFTVDGTLQSGSSGTDEYGLASTACVQPGTDFWFIGAGADPNPIAQLNLVDTDSLTAQVNISEYNSTGEMSGSAQTVDQGLVVKSGSQTNPPGELIDPSAPASAIALNVTATTGRVTTALLAGDSKGDGRDFIAAEQPATRLVIPGVPAPSAGATRSLQLTLMATTADADVTLKWIGDATLTPAVTVPHLSAGHVTTVDISNIPSATESGSLEIDSTAGSPIIGTIKVTETVSGATDTAYLTPVTALTGDSVVAENQTGSSVVLTNESGQAAKVKITTTAQAAAPAAPASQSQTVTVPADASMTAPLTAPAGATQFAVTVTPLNGASQIYAARVMTGSGPLITIQSMATALESVQIPPVRPDLSGTVPQN
jgi:hypothetical protein